MAGYAVFKSLCPKVMYRLWQSLLLSIIVFPHFVLSSQMNGIFLNTQSHCDCTDVTACRRNVYMVTRDKGYNLQLSGNSNFECNQEYAAYFTSAEENGKLCIIQTGKNEIQDNNGLFRVDGCREDDGSVCQLGYYPDNWNWVEKCSLTSNISFHLLKRNNNHKVDLSKLSINVAVVSMDSEQRKLYFDGNYCYKPYQLYNSQVIIYNRPDGRGEDSSKKLCGLSMKNEASDNSSICIVYIPSSRGPDCTSNWTFSVYEGEYELDSSNILYQLNCYEENTSKKHAWCGPKKVRTVSLMYQRQNNEKVESAESFQIIVKDHVGDSLDLLQHFRQKGFHSGNEEDSGGLGTVWIVVICLASFGVILFSICVVRWRFKNRQRRPEEASNRNAEETSRFV